MLCDVFSGFLRKQNNGQGLGTTLGRWLNTSHISNYIDIHIQRFFVVYEDWMMAYFKIIDKRFPDSTLRCFPLHPPLSVEEHKWSRFGTGRVISATSADLGFAKSWLDTCERTHSLKYGCTASAQRPSGLPLSIIDCKTRRVRLAGDGEPYICLSYVWGQSASRATTCGTELPEVVPKTIEDAIFVALELGVPQLWVDQYCISQTSPEDKHNAIASMHLIYAGAVLTIVAAGSDDASSGLPGIRGTFRQVQGHVTIGSSSFIMSHDLHNEVEASQWNTRGW